MTSLLLSLALCVLSPAAMAEVGRWSPRLTNPEAPLPELLTRTKTPDWAQLQSAAGKLLKAFVVPAHDLNELAISFAGDSLRAFEFVRDRIRTEPYAGTLRDPAAVLAAGGGNVQDKSELLFALLSSMGLDARIAEAPMPSTLATALAGAVCAGDRRAHETAAQLAGLTKSDLDRAEARARRDYSRLRAALPASFGDKPAPSAMPGATHYWVQMRDGDGDWLDLDPARREHKLGMALARPLALSRGGANPHKIRIAVRVEELRKGKLVQREVMRHDFAARAIAEVSLSLGFAPEKLSTGGLMADKLSAILGDTPRMRPVLFVGEEQRRGSSFASPGPAAQALMGEGSATSVVVAVWVELSSIAPQRPARTVRRAVIDLLPSAARARGSIAVVDIRRPLKGTRFPLELEGIRHIVVSHGGLDAKRAAARLAGAMLELGQLSRGDTLDPLLALWLGWSRAHGVAVAAESVQRAQPASQSGTCAFVDRPRLFVFALHRSDELHVTSTIDWALDGVQIARDGGVVEAREAAELRLWYGAVQSALETAVMEARAPYLQMTPFSTSLLQDAALVVLGADEVNDLDSLNARSDHADGYLLLAGRRESGAIASWWRVDARSGATDARVAESGNGAGGTGPNRPLGYGRGVSSISPGGQRATMNTAHDKLYQDALEEVERPGKANKTAKEELITLFNVSIPISVVTGVVVGSVVVVAAAAVGYFMM